MQSHSTGRVVEVLCLSVVIWATNVLQVCSAAGLTNALSVLLLSSDRGIAWAPACGKAMAELILQGESSCVNLKPFDPARFTPQTGRGGRGRKMKGTNVGEQW
jgi:hypothetical protein